MQLERITILTNQLLLFLHTSQTSANCPTCHFTSQQKHGFYQRTLQDLAWGEYGVRLYLKVKRFVCTNSGCTTRTFSENLSRGIKPYARRTERCNQTLTKLAFELGGEGTSRLGYQLHLKVSGDTVLRLIRATPLPSHPTPRVLAVDDFAFAKGQTYGTILLDLERHTVVDVLEDREAKTLVNWLKAHPGVEIVSRDRSTTYAEAVKTGAPSAIQVADRFHLKLNLRTATEQFVRRNYLKIKALLKPPIAPMPAVEPQKADQTRVARRLTPVQIRKLRQELAGVPPVPRPLPVREQQKAATQATRMERYQQIHQLHHQGFKQYQIAHQLGIDAGTVSQYLKNPPQPSVISSRAPKLDPYKAYLEHRFFEEGCHKTVQLLAEIKEQGYSGSSSIVFKYVAGLRTELAVQATITPPVTKLSELKSERPKTKIASPRQISWWLCLPEARLKSAEKTQLQRLCEADEEIRRAYSLCQQFSQSLGSRDASGLVLWLRATEEKPISEYVSLAWGIARDRAAVEAGIKLSWNQGQAEGQVNRVKTIKRQMYNRANFDLLRARVLYVA